MKVSTSPEFLQVAYSCLNLPKIVSIHYSYYVIITFAHITYHLYVKVQQRNCVNLSMSMQLNFINTTLNQPEMPFSLMEIV